MKWSMPNGDACHREMLNSLAQAVAGGFELKKQIESTGVKA